jgi:hypothetical protein
MNRIVRRMACVGLVPALLLGLAAEGTAQAAPAHLAPAAAGKTPNPGKLNELADVAAVSPSDTWAVGTYCIAHCSFTQPQTNRSMILHWNGAAWARVASPNPGTYDQLSGVAAVSATDIWAAGIYFSKAGTNPLVLHWNGSKWQEVTVTAPVSDVFTVNAVSVSGANDVWIAGDAGVNRNFVLHWNGKIWTRMNVATLGMFDTLTGISARSPTDAWAAGTYCASGCRGGGSQQTRGIILHWNGAKWRVVAVRVKNAGFSSVNALSRSDVWVTGDRPVGRNLFTPMAAHWNGKFWSWSQDKSVSPNRLMFSSASNGWAVGFGSEFAHWDGKIWRGVVVSGVSPQSSFLGASMASRTDAWAVGYVCLARCVTMRPVQDTIAVHWNGKKWTRK